MIIYLCVILSFFSFSSGNKSPSTLKTIPTCGINEVLNACPAYCTFDKSCLEVILGSVRVCQPPFPPDYVCQPRCDCKTDYVRRGFICEPVAKCCSGQNEEITNCPAPCDETCSGPPPIDCRLSPCAQKGCRCKTGFVRDSSGVCIPKNQCEIDCSPFLNTVFKSCASPCEPSCDNRDPICPDKCVAGCFCKDGYVRDSGDNCIPINECPNSCKENEQYYECGPCQASCDVPNPICTTECVKGCFCVKGFVRDSNGNCIHPSQCPVKRSSVNVCTKKNQIWRTCFGGCDPTCESPDQSCDGCVDGCFCKDGYFINYAGECVKFEDCEKCGPNEVFTKCLPCTNAICPLGCMPGCICAEGYSYNKDGVCVKVTPKPQCTGQNEEYSECAKKCPPNARCITDCLPGCVCKQGFIRKKGVCVKADYKGNPY